MLELDENEVKALLWAANKGLGWLRKQGFNYDENIEILQSAVDKLEEIDHA